MISEPDWNHYRTLVAVIKTGSLSGAARVLNLTQPTVSRHVDALEAACGITLFLRTQRGLDPTEMALRLMPLAQAIAATSAAMARLVTEAADDVRGTIRISASEIIGAEILPPILSVLRRRHPALVIELVLSNAVDDLLRRQADIAVRMTEPVQGALISRRLPPVALGLFAHKDYLARKPAPLTQADLKDHDVIGFDVETPALRDLVQNHPTLNRAAFALRTDSDVAQLAAIRAGFGIGLCQVAIAQREPDIIPVLSAEVSINLGLWVVMHEDLKTSTVCRAVFDGLVEGLQTAARRSL